MINYVNIFHLIPYTHYHYWCRQGSINTKASESKDFIITYKTEPGNKKFQ